MLDTMSTSDIPGPPSAGLPPSEHPAPARTLRRSEDNRVAAGVAGGLGEYLGVDPVIFRVLFATAAFFGGAGIVAYLIAWAAIPERSQAHAPVDRFVAGLRSRNVFVWTLSAVAVVLIWAGMFSWWGPHGWFFPRTFVPLLVVGIILIVALQGRRPVPPRPDATAAQPAADTVPVPQQTRELDAWAAQKRAAARERRRRSAPVRWITVGVLLITLTVLGIVDATHGIVIPAYFWAAHFVVLGGLIVGAVLRRPIWWMALLLIPAAAGTFVFAGCRASLHDGSGDNTFTPRSAADLNVDYRQAFGRTRLDLTQMSPLDTARTVHITQAGGQVELLVPRTMAVTVHGNVHIGNIRVDGQDDSGGMYLNSDLVTAGSGNPLTIDVRINAGQLMVDHVG